MEKIINLLNNPLEINSSDIFTIQDGIEKYPFFQPLRLIHLKAVENDEQKLKESLQKAAVFIQNRGLIFEYLKAKPKQVIEKIDEKKETKCIELDDKITDKPIIISDDNGNSKNIEHANNDIIKQSIKDKDIAKFKREITESKNIQEIQNNNSEKINLKGNYKFNDWLNIVKKDDDKFKIIDEFLNKNPKITPTKEFKPSSSLNLKNKNLNLSHLMTETLANIYTEQGKYTKAIKAFNILRLKYPEKSGYFADQIKKIEELKNK